MLNWIVRYAVVAALLEEEGWTDGSILDVGSGPHGLSCVRPELPFVGLDVEFPAPVVRTMTGLQAPPGPLPFADGAFDTVINLDTLEHIPADERQDFIAELVRVSARRVVLACPERRGASADDVVARLLLEEGQPEPPWLSEHREFGLPAEEDVRAMCAAMPGCTARPFPTVNALLSLLAVFGDVHPDLAPAAAEEVAERTAEWERLFLAGRFGPAARTAWVIERDAPTNALVSGTDPHGSLVPALRCLDCGGQQRDEAETWVCTGCGRVTSRAESSGAWVLGAVPPPHPAPVPAPPVVNDSAARIAELEAQLAHVTAQRDHARRLRIVRWTAPLRRAAYRLRSRGS